MLLYLAERPERIASTEEISAAYAISRHHLVRVVKNLGETGFVRITTGRSGGVALARSASAIRIGDVVRCTEPSFRIVECFDSETNQCPIVPVCKLRGVLKEALTAFLDVLDKYTLADLIQMPEGKKLSLFFLDVSSGRAVFKQREQ